MMKRGIPSWLIYLPLVVIPFVYVNTLVDPGQMPQLAFLFAYMLILLSGVLIKTWRKSDADLVWSRAFTYLSIFLGISAVQVFSVPLVAEGMLTWLKMFAFFLLMFLIKQYSQKGNVLYDVSRMLTLTTFLLFVILFWQMSLFNVLEYDHQASYRLNATLGHRNLLSQYVLLLLPFNFFVRNDKVIWIRWLSRIQLLIGLVLLLILFSRAVWVAFLVSVMGTFVMSRLSGHQPEDIKITIRKWMPMLLLSVGLIMVIAFGHPTVRNVLFTQSVTTVNTGYGTAKDRLILWEKTWHMFQEHPWNGVGPGHWKIHFLKSGVKGTLGEDGKTFYQRPHNDFLWILAENGIFVFLLYAMFWLILMVAVWNKLTSDKQEQQQLGLFATFFLLSFGCISIFSFPIERIPHMTLFALVSALVMDSKIVTNFRWGKRILFLGLAVISSLGLLFLVVRMHSDANLRMALQAKANKQWEQLASYASEANNQWYTIDPTSTPCAWYVGLAHYFTNDIDKAFTSFKEAYAVNPFHIHVLNNLATCYNQMDSANVAIGLYQEALRINPVFSDARYNQAILQFQQEQILQADSNMRYLIQNELFESHMQPLIDALADYQIRELAQSIENPIELEVLSRLLNDPTWMKDLYFKAVDNGLPFERQLMLDVSYIIEKDNLTL